MLAVSARCFPHLPVVPLSPETLHSRPEGTRCCATGALPSVVVGDVGAFANLPLENAEKKLCSSNCALRTSNASSFLINSSLNGATQSIGERYFAATGRARPLRLAKQEGTEQVPRFICFYFRSGTWPCQPENKEARTGREKVFATTASFFRLLFGLPFWPSPAA